jgi:hypothetical protein
MSNWLTDGGDWGDIEESLPAGGGAYKPVPKGDYECEVMAVTTRAVDNARATGTQVKVEIRIIEGDYKGRKVFGGHLVEYRSKLGDDEKAAKTERIGRGKFKALCGAVGIDKKPNDLSALVGKSVKVAIGIGKRPDGGEDNEIFGYVKSAYFAPVAKPVGGFDPWA